MESRNFHPPLSLSSQINCLSEGNIHTEKNNNNKNYFFITNRENCLTPQKDKYKKFRLSKDDKSIYYVEIVDYLNSAIGTQYRAETATTKKHIDARLNEGFTVDDFKTVIDKKAAEWLGTEMEKYLRPETLFGTKFESYLNAKVKPIQPTKQKQPGSNIFLELAMEEGAF